MVGITRSTVCQLYVHITLYMCKEEEVRSGGDSSSDNWRSLAVVKIGHFSDYCIAVLCCQSILHFLATLCTGQKGHNIASLLKLMSSILLLRKQYACQDCQSVITAKAHGHNFMGQLSINKNPGV